MARADQQNVEENAATTSPINSTTTSTTTALTATSSSTSSSLSSSISQATSLHIIWLLSNWSGESYNHTRQICQSNCRDNPSDRGGGQGGGGKSVCQREKLKRWKEEEEDEGGQGGWSICVHWQIGNCCRRCDCQGPRLQSCNGQNWTDGEEAED